MTTSNGAATVIDATAPAMEATKSVNVKELLADCALTIEHATTVDGGDGHTLTPCGLRIVGKLEQVLLHDG